MVDLALGVGVIGFFPLLYLWNIIFKTGFIPYAPPDTRPYDAAREFYASLTPLVDILWMSSRLTLAVLFNS